METQLEARNYQIEVFRKATKQNTIAFLPTGSGKTFISILLIREFSHETRLTGHLRKWTVFLVPVVCLAEQQARAIRNHTDLNVGVFTGDKNVDFWDKAQWQQQLDEHQVLVMTAQIFYNIQMHAVFNMNQCNLLIFDECHHATKEGPYNRIMQDFYKKNFVGDVKPRIFGMTASPVKENVTEAQIVNRKKSLEVNMDAKIFSVPPELLGEFLAKPKERPPVRFRKEDVRYISSRFEALAEALPWKALKLDANTKKKMDQYHDGAIRRIVSTIESLGAYCALNFVKSVKSEAASKLQEEKSSWSTFYRSELEILNEVERIIIQYYQNTGKSLRSYSKKVAQLMEILLQQEQKDFRGIVFVEQRQSCVLLSQLVNDLFGDSFLKAGVLVGHGDNVWKSRYSQFSAGVNVETSDSMKSKQQLSAVEDFRNGKINLLIATSVAEEGLDIPKCRLVVRFDSVPTMKSHIQSKGRARFASSEYIVFEDEDLPQGVSSITATNLENKLRAWCENEADVIQYGEEMDSHEALLHYRTKIGAVLTEKSAVGVLSHYCSKLPSDDYFRPKAEYEMVSTPGTGSGYRCIVRLPGNAQFTLQGTFGAFFRSATVAKQVAAFEACKQLHETGGLTDNLLPFEEDEEVPAASSPAEKNTNFAMKSSAAFAPKFRCGDEGVKVKMLILQFGTGADHFACLALLYPFENKVLESSDYRNVTMFSREKPFQVEITRYEGDIQISNEDFARCKRFHEFVVQDLGKLSLSDCPEWSFVVVPLECSHDTTGEIFFNWKLINSDLANKPWSPEQRLSPGQILIGQHNMKWIFQNFDEDTGEIECKKANFSRPYLNNPKTHSVGGVKRLNTAKTQFDVHPFSADIYMAFKALPSLLWRLENRFLAQELLDNLGISLTLEMTMMSLTAASAHEEYCLERLELLGDSFINWVSSLRLFIEYPSKHEGHLTKMKHREVRNTNLRRLALNRNFQDFIVNETLQTQHWVPPGWPKRPRYVPDKTIADVVEALAGACLLQPAEGRGKLDKAFDFLKAIEFCNVDMDSLRSANTHHKKSRELEAYTHMAIDVPKLEGIIGYTFKNKNLLIEAFTHASCQESVCYQRLEFLGDATLGFLVTCYFYEIYPELDPGRLTDLKSVALSNQTFATIAAQFSLHKFIRQRSKDLHDAITKFVEEVEVPTGDENSNAVPKTLGDVFESLAGAVLLDSDLDVEAVWNVFSPMITDYYERHVTPETVEVNPVTWLLHTCQSFGCSGLRKRKDAPSSRKVKGAFVWEIHGREIGEAEGQTSRSSAAKRAKNFIETNPQFLAEVCDCAAQKQDIGKIEAF
eukprot:TRINITY_DN5592_c0_g2_i1.p1 TRINITY_DN5592_c0_g2~~TRINITY_DN5592_c0_g2_i1.p1  ORF type:complete len:1321 (-),score=333.81 TRINITY_DN5592_c0_g2_i1:25-3987(-)